MVNEPTPRGRAARVGTAPPGAGAGALALLVLLGGLAMPSPACAQGPFPEPRTIHVFYDNIIHFTPDDTTRYDTAIVNASDRGRRISRTVNLRRPPYPVRLLARVTTRPIPKDAESVYDGWDRAGNVRLVRSGKPDIELVKFITAYGGVTEHEVDISHLVDLLDGPCTFVGFVDTWISPGWKMDFELVYEPVDEIEAVAWVEGILYEESVTAAKLAAGPMTVEVDVPDGLSRVVMNYLVSGHCTDGRDADEFESKDNVITVDGREAYRYRPWRSDCIRFRTINPYCRRWSDGSWSSDYSRSGWCPGDVVLPHEIDLSAFLGPGKHVIGFDIENVRPKDGEGNFGYWRVSSQLLGYRE